MARQLMILDSVLPHVHEAAKILTENGGWHIQAATSNVVLANATCAHSCEVFLVEPMLERSTAHNVVIINQLRNALPNMAIIVILPFGEMDMASQLMHAGADDFLNKPLYPLRLKVTIDNACDVRSAKAQKMPEFSGPSNPHEEKGLVPITDEKGKLRQYRELEFDMIRLALDYHGGSIAKTARSLGIGRSTLYRKMACAPN